MLHYHILGEQSLSNIVDYLLTFVGEISVQKEGNSATIFYTDSPTTAYLKMDGKTIDLICQENDSVTVNLIKNITSRHGSRIFNVKTQAFLVNDSNVLDITNNEIKKEIVSLLINYGLIPIFQYRDTLIYYLLDKEGKIHITNRHLLDYLLKNPQKKLYPGQFSRVVANNMAEFVALFDRGLISPSFFNQPKVINLNGVDINKLKQNIEAEFIYFVLDSTKQTFVQTDYTHLPHRVSLKKGGSLLKIVKTPYLAIKIGQDIDYQTINKDLLFKLHVSVFLKA